MAPRAEVVLASARVESTALSGGSGAASESREQRARRALDENPWLWYHTIELAPGVVTPGYIDLRKAAAKVLPPDLSGKRALDIGTFDGFWAFELERRGASVVATDLADADEVELPPLNRRRIRERTEQTGFELGTGFRIAHDVLGSAVRRVETSIYDLDRDVVGGEVDFVFLGAVLIHLRNPVLALERIRDLLAPGGELRSFEPISAYLTARAPRRPAAQFRPLETDFTWWLPNLAAHKAWALTAGFGTVERVALSRPPCQQRTLYAALTCSD